MRSLPVVLKLVTPANGAHAGREINAQAPTGDIYLVGAVVEGFSGPPMPEPMPVVVNQPLLIRPARRRTLPKFIVQPGRNRAGPEDGFPAGIGIPGFGHVYLPDHPFVKQLDTLGEHRRRTTLCTHLYHTVILARCGHRHLSLCRI